MNRPSPAYPLFVTNDCDKLSTDSGKLSTDHESSEIISVQCGSDDINTRVSSSPLFLPQSKPSPYPKYTLIPTLLNHETNIQESH